MFRLLTLFTVIAALCAGGMVYGQDELGTRQETQGIATREPTTTPLAQAPPDEPKTFKIAPQALDGALIEFSAVTGIQVLVEGELTAGVASPGVSGSLPPEQALQRLLANSDLTYRFTSANTVTLEQAPADAGQAPITLPAITVTAAESAFGPDEGYVTGRSATGTKTDTPLIEVPQTINVITRDEIEARPVTSTSDAVAYAPGVVSNAATNLDTRFDSFNLRGFAAPEFLNGLALLGTTTFAVPRIEPYGLQRIEILKGPASMLYGQIPPGGLVNYVSKRPTTEPFRELQLLGGSFDRVQGALDFSGPIDEEGQFLYRLTALARDSGTQVDFLEEQRYFIAPSFTWQPNPDTSFTFLGQYQKDDNQGNPNNFFPLEGTLLPNPNGPIAVDRYAGEPGFDRYEREQYMLGYTFEHRFNNAWSVRQHLRYTDVTLDYQAVAPSGSFLTDDEGVPTDFRTITRFGFLLPGEAESFTADNQAQAVFDTGKLRHTLLLGIDYRHLDALRDSRSFDAPNLDVFSPVYSQPLVIDLSGDREFDTETDQVGIYAQDQVKFNDWIVTLGGRYDWADTDELFTDRLDGSQTETRQDDEAFTYRVGLGYLFDSGVVPYVSYSESFEPAIGTDAFGTPFEPTEGQQYEVGVKYQPPELNVLITLSGFELTQQNVLTPDPDPTREDFSVQTGEVRVRGAELETKASLMQGLEFTAAYAYYDSEITESNELGEQGNDLSFAPEHQASVWLDYTFQGGALSGLDIGAGVRHVGDYFGELANTTENPNFTLVDAALRYELGRVHKRLEGAHLTVYVNNLFDREFFVGCGFATCEYGEQRSIYASLRYNW